MTCEICSLAPGGGGLGTLAEPAKNEPCETACRMAEGANITLKPSPEFVTFTLVLEQILPSHKERGLKM